MYGEALHMLLSGRGKGVEVDFQSHNLVAIATSVTALSTLVDVGCFHICWVVLTDRLTTH